MSANFDGHFAAQSSHSEEDPLPDLSELGARGQLLFQRSISLQSDDFDEYDEYDEYGDNYASVSSGRGGGGGGKKKKTTEVYTQKHIRQVVANSSSVKPAKRGPATKKKHASDGRKK